HIFLPATSPPFPFTLSLHDALPISLFALILASLGIYGVISYSINQRTQEIGIRMALGASAGDLQARIIMLTLALALIGMLVGGAASWALARMLSGLLFGVAPNDPVTFLGVRSEEHTSELQSRFDL